MLASGFGPDGVILTATLTNDPDPDEDVFEVALDQITVPVLIATHKRDDCPATPPSDTDDLAAALTGSPKVKAKFFDGGYLPISENCSPLGPHGFFKENRAEYYGK